VCRHEDRTEEERELAKVQEVIRVKSQQQGEVGLSGTGRDTGTGRRGHDSDRCIRKEQKRQAQQAKPKENLDVERKDETHRRSHPEKPAYDEQRDPNTDSPYAPDYILKTHTQQIEQSAWCAHGEEEERSKRIQTDEAKSNQEENQKDARWESHPEEQKKAEY